MKRLFLYLLALMAFFPQCKKNKSQPPAVLPAITQEGKNTFGCKVDGEIWVPYYKCGGSGNPCGELYANFYKTNATQKAMLPLSFSFGFGKRLNDEYSYFTIETKMGIGIHRVGNKIDTVSILFHKPNSGLSYFNQGWPNNHLNKFEITKIDTINKIISGVFEAVIYKSPTDSVRLAEGRFDLKFGVCKCSP